jgi:phosphatidylserine/phosphatidylglycerophosphate/cardiolipin synthase-like enzyme
MSTRPSLSAVPTEVLRALRDRLLAGTLEVPLYEAALRSHGLAAAWPFFKGLAPTHDAPTLLTMLDVALAERDDASHPQIDVVWTGPEAIQSTARDTTIVVNDIFSKATQEVFVAGYTFDNGGQILAPLHRAMGERGVKARIVLDIPRSSSESPGEQVAAHVQAFFDGNWPFGPPFPELYHDPRTSGLGVYASMHATVIIVDTRWSLIGSANFTRRAQDRNLEMGVLIDAPWFARQVVQHWQGLIDQKYLVPVHVGQ